MVSVTNSSKSQVTLGSSHWISHPLKLPRSFLIKLWKDYLQSPNPFSFPEATNAMHMHFLVYMYLPFILFTQLTVHYIHCSVPYLFMYPKCRKLFETSSAYFNQTDWLKSQLYYLIAGRPQTQYVIFLNLSFLFCKIKTSRVPLFHTVIV